jgi:hypothetical protein
VASESHVSALVIGVTVEDVRGEILDDTRILFDAPSVKEA